MCWLSPPGADAARNPAGNSELVEIACSDYPELMTDLYDALQS